MEFSTRLDLYELGRNYVRSRAQRIEPAAVDTEGTDVNLMIGAASFMAYAVQRQNIEGLSNLLLDNAEDENLDRWIYDRYEETRKGASAAIVPVQITRPTFTNGAGQVPIGTVVNSLDGIDYVLLDTAVFSATGLTTTGAVRARAVQAGKNFQVGSNMIRRFAKPNLLFDATLQINNADPAAGGEPAETNDVCRERVRRFWRSARRGTLAAIEFGALTVPGVVSAEAVDVLEDGEPARLVELFIADSSGVANVALAALVRVALNEWRGGGVRVLINTSRPVIVDVALRLNFRAGVDTVTLGNNVRAAIVTYINSLGVNRPLLRLDLGTVLARFKDSGLILTDDSIVAPLGDTYPEAGTTIRTRYENVTIAT